MSETEEVRNKFSDLLTHLGTMEGVEAIGDYLPIFVASMLDAMPSREIKEIGLAELATSVRAHWDSLAEYERATRQ